MDRLFQDLNHVTQKNLAESVHLADLPKVNKKIIDADLEKRDATSTRYYLYGATIT